MRKRSTNARNDRGAPKTRLSTKVVAGIATFSLVASMCPCAAALAFANGQSAGESAGEGLAALGSAGLVSQGWDYNNFQEVTENTHVMASGSYIVKRDVTIKPDKANGIRLNKGGKVYLYIEKGCTLTVTGIDGNLNRRGGAAILMPIKSTLVVAGEGTLNATGGHGGPGRDGGNAGGNEVDIDKGIAHVGAGGNGGMGGCGAGAGIGTNGGSGAYSHGGRGGGGVTADGYSVRSNVYGNAGAAGQDGRTADEPGTLVVMGTVTVNATGGASGASGKAGSKGGYAQDRTAGTGTACGTSGGGGGGGGGSAGDGIGYGGSAGGGGGGGASGSIDGECAGWVADLDNLWSHGGGGGACWGTGAGGNGEEGANGGDGNGKYARSGGAGGASPAPKAVAFYTYKANGASSGPTVNCSSGHGVTRQATTLSTLDEFKKIPGCAQIVSGGTFTYDGKPHGASVDAKNGESTQSAEASALSAQADDATGEWPDSGTVKVDGVEVDWSIAYYDEAGKKLDSVPVMPGEYAAVVSFKCQDAEKGEDYTGDWVEQVTIAKRQIAKPTPADLVFECGNWNTGEGAEQDAFPSLDETDYEFVKDAKDADGNVSLKSASEVGGYQACFKLKDPATCQWAGEPENASEIWVPWSIKLAPFDPNSKEVTYWGTAPDNKTTTVTYTGEPIWVRPWWTPAKSTDGKFPEWFTHWGSKDRPTTDRRSALVMYLQGDDDREGLVGYHTNANGSLEKVTGEQVYAWMFGVDIDGEHVAVEAGDKVWYKTDDDGWKIPLAVQGAGTALAAQSETALATQAEKPEGAEGYVVARDLAYADRLGVKDEGTYHAYAYFDEGAGFEATSLAEATVKVKPAAKTAKTGTNSKTSASVTPKTGDFSPFIVGGIILVGLLAAGALALPLVRRRR